MSDLKKEFEKVKGLAKAKPDNDFLNSLLEQMADGHSLSTKQQEVLKEIEKEVKEMGEMKAELKQAQRIATKYAYSYTSASGSMLEGLLSGAESNLREAAENCNRLAGLLKKKGFHVGELKAVSKMCHALIKDLSRDSDIARDVGSAGKTAASDKTAAPSSSFEALSAYWLKAGKKLATKLTRDGRFEVEPMGTYGVRIAPPDWAHPSYRGDTFFNILWRSGKIEVVGGVTGHPGKYKKNFPLSTPTQDIFKGIADYHKKWAQEKEIV